MRILGADLSGLRTGRRGGENTLVLLDDDARITEIRRPANLPEVAAQVADLADDEPFLVGVNVPVVVPPRQSRTRTVENLVRRRLGYRLPPGGRAATGRDKPHVTGESLLAALAAAGHPCLPYPDRDRRRSSLAEAYPGLALKSLLWEETVAAKGSGQPHREEIFRALTSPSYQSGGGRAKASWASRAVALDLVLRTLGETAGFDLEPTGEALAGVGSDNDVDRAASLFDASLLAGTARRYVTAPETCAFLGSQDTGYTILPADGFIRRMALREGAVADDRLFPSATLRDRLGSIADLRPVDLLDLPGRARRIEAVFHSPSLYEFDNVDEMMWWKHCRHLSGAALPTDGLHALTVELGAEAGSKASPPLTLARSRHRILSFRFDPPGSWRTHLPTRDGKTYAFRVLRAIYEISPGAD